jgi:hypothetical protein
MLLLIIFALGTLICAWIWGDTSFRTNCILTAIFAASWGSLWIPEYGRIVFPLSQAIFAIVVGAMTFGIDWIMRDAWHVR